MLGGAQVGEQGGHLVEGAPPNGLVVSRARQVVPDLLLVVPEQPVQGVHIGVTHKGHAVAARLHGFAVRRDLHYKPRERGVGPPSETRFHNSAHFFDYNVMLRPLPYTHSAQNASPTGVIATY